MAQRPRPRTVSVLAEDLRRLGVRPGDLLMVHASLRAVGPVEGGADGVIDALEAAIGPEGSLLINVGVLDDCASVNERPESERAALLEGTEPFDTRVAAADPDNGVLAEVFRRRPRTLVSDHPEGRFGASGPRAEELIEQVPWDDYYGPNSPLERLVRADGRVLRLGADLETMTLLHYAEYLACIPDKRRVRRHRLVAGPNGPELRVIECLDDCDGIVDYPEGDYFGLLVEDYLRKGRAIVGRVGGATSELIEAVDIVTFATTWMEAHF
jgi:aminoglycoside N3'-acetyltransferase